MKKLLLVIISLTIILGLGACDSTSQDTQEDRVVETTNTLSDSFDREINTQFIVIRGVRVPK